MWNMMMNEYKWYTKVAIICYFFFVTGIILLLLTPRNEIVLNLDAEEPAFMENCSKLSMFKDAPYVKMTQTWITRNAQNKTLTRDHIHVEEMMYRDFIAAGVEAIANDMKIGIDPRDINMPRDHFKGRTTVVHFYFNVSGLGDTDIENFCQKLYWLYHPEKNQGTPEYHELIQEAWVKTWKEYFT